MRLYQVNNKIGDVESRFSFHLAERSILYTDKVISTYQQGKYISESSYVTLLGNR